MRKILLALLPFLLLGCSENSGGSSELTDFIPGEAAIVLQLGNPDLFFSNLKNNGFLKTNASHPLQQGLQDRLSFLEHFSHKSPALLSFSAAEENRFSYTFISSGVPEIKSLDSLKARKVETISLGGTEIKKYTLNGEITFTSSVDSVFIASDSRETLEKSLKSDNENLQKHPDFQRALKAASEKHPSVYINHGESVELLGQLFPDADFQRLKDFSNWTVLDIEISQSSLALNGISTATDSLPKTLNLFKGVSPAPTELALVAPLESKGFHGINFEDFSVLHKNLLAFNDSKETTSKDMEVTEASNDEEPVKTSDEIALLKASLEAGMIYLPGTTVFAVRPREIVGAAHSFSAGKEVAEEFRGIPIYTYSEGENFRKLLTPLLKPETLNYFLSLDQFLLFAEDIETLKTLVTSFQNKNSIGQSEAYLSASKSLSTESSLLWVGINRNFKAQVAEKVSPEFREATEDLSFAEYPVSAVQFIYQNDYAHVHAVLEKTQAPSAEEGPSQRTSVHLGAELAAPPTFFQNHRTQGLDIVIQDKQNTLYLISQQGKIYWKKQLDSRILGEIRQVDLYKNGRIQLAFSTAHKVHVIDRDGNEVAPFPWVFRDVITQPVSIFDYAGNRNYRFVVIQGTKVYMFDKEGDPMRGFKFSETAEEIIQPAKHIRLGTKDYILVAEASGKLNILNRTGGIRVPVREEFVFSENPWFGYENQFVSTNQNGQLLRISQSGKISKEELGLAENHRIDATAKTLATLSENELSIKGKTVSLDYGLYTEPQIFYINNKLYITVTDLQAERVYLFDSSATLLPDFPVYGTSPIDLGNADGDANLEFVVQGEKDEVLVYEISR